MPVLTILALAWLLMEAASRQALAELPRLQLTGALPCSAADIHRALALRGFVGPSVAPQLSLSRSNADEIVIRDTEGHELRVQLLASHSAAASARLLALVLIDFLQTQEQQAPLLEPPGAAAPAVAPTPTQQNQEQQADLANAERPPQPSKPAAPTAGPLLLTGAAGLGAGTQSEEPRTLLALIRLGYQEPRWVVEAGVEGWLTPGGPHAQGLQLRVQGGLHAAPWTWTLGPVLTVLQVDLPGAPSGIHGLLFGLGSTFSAEAALNERWGLVGLVGVDFFARRLQLRGEGNTVITTPRFAAWLAFGVRWRGQR